MRLRDEPSHRGGLGYFEKVVGETDGVGFFSFNPSVKVVTPRCDEGFWGPSSFHGPLADGTCSCGNVDVDKATAKVCVGGVVDVDDIVYASAFYSRPPIGFIAYSEMKDPEIEELLCRNHWNSQARTLQELLKLMLEWKDVFEDLDDISPIAVTASGLIDSMSMPVEVETWIRGNVPDGPVYKFLNGDTDARDRTETVPDLPDFVSEWLRSIVDENSGFGGTSGNAKRI